MKNATFAILLTLILAVCGAAAEDEITKAENDWVAAVTGQDFAALDRILHDDLIYAHSTGVIETKSDYLGKLRSGAQRYDAIEHSRTTVKMHGDAAVAHSIVRMKGKSPTGPFDNRLMMIHLWVKHDGRWRLAAHQTTELTK